MRERTPSLAGKTAVVTGAGKRLGRFIALALAADGANVVVHYHGSADDAGEVARRAGDLGVKAWTLQADLIDESQAAGLIARAAELAGPIDVLVNSASIFTQERIGDFTPERLWRNLRANALAPLLASRALAGQKRPGDIVNLLDARVVDYDTQHAAYHLSKRMLLDITRMTALEFAPLVRVNGVAPGLILPPAGQDESYLQRLASTNPLNRLRPAGPIADAVLFLLKSTFITGQVIFVDGGRHMKGDMYG